MPKNLCFQTVVLEKTLESPLDCKEIQPVHPNGDQSWVFIGRTDAEAPIFWPPDVKSQLTGKHLNAGKDWRQEEKRLTEHEMVGWHHWLNGHEFEKTQENGEGQGCCSPWGRRVRHNWVTELSQQNIVQKSHGHLNRWRKIISKNPTPTHIKKHSTNEL